MSVSRQVILGLGSNFCHEDNMQRALSLLQDTFGALSLSPIYKSQPSATTGSAIPSSNSLGRYYYNGVVCCNSELSVAHLKQQLKKIERICERDRSSTDDNGAPVVTIDIDLLLVDDWVGVFDEVVLPHPDILTCVYVLRPLADMLPERVHPVKNKTMGQLWECFRERLGVDQLTDPVDFVWDDHIVSISPSCMSL